MVDIIPNRGWKGFKHYIKIHFGVEFMLAIIRLQKYSRKLAHIKNNIYFLKKCKIHEILPTFVRIPKSYNKIQSRKSRQLIQKLEFDLLNESIKCQYKNGKDTEFSMNKCNHTCSFGPKFKFSSIHIPKFFVPFS